MKSLRTFVFIVGGLASFQVYGQSDCKREKVIGEWRYATSDWGIHTNIDSMRQIASQAKDTLGGLWNFRSDGNCLFRHPSYKKQSKLQPFSFDSIRCEIILGKRKGKNRFNLEIIYVDSSLLIYKSDNNPKGYNTVVLIRK